MVAGQGSYMITLYNFSVCDTTTWVLDTKSSICNVLQRFQVSRMFEKVRDSETWEMEVMF